MHTGVYHSLDFAAEGKSTDFLSIPFSVDRSPYFQVKVPMVRIKRGTGPRVLLMAGNHGDEYEGEFSLMRLIRRLEPDMVKGEITILPLANTPAVMAARRRSPLDDGNLNRAFPGDLAGSPTFRIAYFLERELFPRHDVIFDLHSGGTTMAHLPCALIERQGPPDRFARALDLMKATGLGHGFIAENGATAPTSMAAAARAGAIGLSGEFGGGGTVTPATMAATSRAIDNVLLALGAVDEPVLGAPSVDAAPMQLLALDSHEQSIFATRRGWFEPAVALGVRVQKGDVAGWYHDLSRVDATEETLRFHEAGIVIARRLPADSQAGDCLIQVARPVDDRTVLTQAL
ncbi:succinylglutamate desuccinylase/aspartoacylase domain-containing protein [Microvirga mediterraneensis]|uniref:Succinylglutamate desuccinylase/aspartoacylase family protein n=1 Tax=Microvirga mediterraneensis TaxID=2754695 RepID=A0A838BIV0_9HYPH|nr:succinylglutamate desuccinylase/aspartoacylase family protein [Microvirga mediterraneensis]MBA1154592.1 succinylglutamate desuccinylase/aspartoacylase family protein [Microvirga mediterraneensis]